MGDFDVSPALAIAVCAAVIVLFQFIVAQRSSSAAGAASSTTATRKDLHVQRKLQHAGTGLLIYSASRLFSWQTGSAALLGFALAFLALDAARKASARVNALFLHCFHGILRQDEAQRRAVPAAFFFLLGSSLALMLFSAPVARLAILHVSVGDPAASYVGVRFGRKRLPSWTKGSGGKSVEGFVACWGSAGLATLTALVLESDYYNLHWLPSVGVALAAGAAAAVAEATDVGVDDNLSLPLLSGLFMQLSSAVTGGLSGV